MSFNFVLIILPLLVLQSSCQIDFCEKIRPLNEVYSRKVSQCHNTCFNQKFNQSYICASALGFVCKEGYIRDQETFQCIPITSCLPKNGPKHCAKNEIYSECDCFKTCQSRNVTRNCTCKKGCACKPGFFRSDINFQCIPEYSCSKCPQGYTFSKVERRCILNCKSCKANESFKMCGNYCSEPSCSNPTSAGVFCTQQCQEGCFCNKGYVRSPLDGSCVLVKNCPKQECPENESWRCGNPSCEPTCQNFHCKDLRPCQNKCFCDPGYIRGLDGSQCVQLAQCPIINTQKRLS